MKRYHKILLDYAEDALNSPSLIDVKLVHRPKLKLIIQSAFFDGMNFMAKQYNKALTQLDTVLDEELSAEETPEQPAADEDGYCMDCGARHKGDPCPTPEPAVKLYGASGEPL